MPDFVNETFFMLLTLFAAAMTFGVSLLRIVAKNKSVRFLVVGASLAFVALTIVQLATFFDAQEKAREAQAEKHIKDAARKALEKIIKETNLTAKRTEVTATETLSTTTKTLLIVDTLEKRLGRMSIEEVTTGLVSVQSSGISHFEDAYVFAKGNVEVWEKYAGWLDQISGTDAAPSLSLTLNRSYEYSPGVLLIYLLTSDATRARLENVLHQGTWDSFDAESVYLENIPFVGSRLRWVLFYDKEPSNLVAFAEADEFTRELMTYRRANRNDQVRNVLNDEHEAPTTLLQKQFPSVRTNIFRTDDPAKVVRGMIEEKIAVSVASFHKKAYVAHLQRMIEIAARDELPD